MSQPRPPAVDLGAAFEQVPPGLDPFAIINRSMQGTMDTAVSPFLASMAPKPRPVAPPSAAANRLSQKKLAHEAASQPWDRNGSVFAGIEDYGGVMPKPPPLERHAPLRRGRNPVGG